MARLQNAYHDIRNEKSACRAPIEPKIPVLTVSEGVESTEGQTNNQETGILGLHQVHGLPGFDVPGDSSLVMHLNPLESSLS